MAGNADTAETFKLKANHKHGEGAFGYDHVVINKQQPVAIWCYNHNGLFHQKPADHLSGRGCNICRKSRQKTDAEWKEAFGIKHDNKYDYSRANNIKAKHKLPIICPTHGLFEQEATSHLGGCGCPTCGFEAGADIRRVTNEEFKEQSTHVHAGRYLYPRTDYIRRDLNVIITCREHGDFQQLPGNHLAGKGCSKCRLSSGEREISRYLTELGIQFEEQKRYNDCRNILPLPFDFYIPEYNALIEFDGIQHSEPRERFGGEDGFAKTVINDGIKNRYAAANNIKLLRIRYDANVETAIDTFIMNECL